MADKNLDDMSDEEVLEDFSFDDLTDDPVEEAEEQPEEVAEESEESEELAEDESDEPEEVEEDASEEEQESSQTTEEETLVEQEGDEGEEEEESEHSSGGSAEEQIKELFSPFKANGAQMSIKSVAEAKQLMQMGANYTKKMLAIKPYLQRAQTLEHNELTDDDINLLVDLKKGDPKAIKKLLDDVNIDALDLDLEDHSGYKATDYSVSSAEFELNSVLDEIKESEHYDKTINVIGNQWDEDSRIELSQNPELIRGMHEQVANGDYDIVNAEVVRERALGRLTNVTDLEAYVTTFKRLQSAAQPSGQKDTGQNRSLANQRSKRKVDPRTAARKAAASTKKPRKTKSGSRMTQAELDRMSDEDFLKVNADEFNFV